MDDQIPLICMHYIVKGHASNLYENQKMIETLVLKECEEEEGCSYASNLFRKLQPWMNHWALVDKNLSIRWTNNDFIFLLKKT